MTRFFIQTRVTTFLSTTSLIKIFYRLQPTEPATIGAKRRGHVTRIGRK